jgi:phenylalanyl-tRNA synthetase beta chain
MPVIGIPVEDLLRRVGGKVDRDDLLTVLGEMGCDVEGFAVLRRSKCAACGYVIELAGREEIPPHCDRCGRDLRTGTAPIEMSPLEVIRMELLAVRPDMFDPAGLARAVRGVLSIETGLPRYEVAPPSYRVSVDDSVRRSSSSRPHIACAVLENVSLDDDSVKILMKLQENLHWALGRNRKHASIGVYDLDALGEGTELEYTTEDPERYAFVPLGATRPAPEGEMSLRRILEEHPKGRAFAHLLEGFDRYPILRASSGAVLSMPPIINSEETKVHTGSRRLFVDVTGLGARIVNRTLNILVTSMMELDPEVRASAVEIAGATAPEGSGKRVTLRTPDLTPQEMGIDAGHTERILGIPCPPERLRGLLQRMRHGIPGAEGTRLRVEVPAYRNDILHERDLMEDAAIAYGYANIPRTLVPTLTVGRELNATRRSDDLREVLVGLGFLEVMTLNLTSPEQSDLLLDLEPHPATVLLDNPISVEQTQLRTSLLPGLLQTFARNRHNALPQEIFELGEVSFASEKAETGAEERLHLAFGVVAPKVGFAEARALIEALVRELGWGLALAEARRPFLLDGRAAMVKGPGGREAGTFGEVHPRVLERLGLQNPAIVGEIAI